MGEWSVGSGSSGSWTLQAARCRLRRQASDDRRHRQQANIRRQATSIGCCASWPAWIAGAGRVAFGIIGNCIGIIGLVDHGSRRHRQHHPHHACPCPSSATHASAFMPFTPLSFIATSTPHTSAIAVRGCGLRRQSTRHGSSPTRHSTIRPLSPLGHSAHSACPLELAIALATCHLLHATSLLLATYSLPLFTPVAETAHSARTHCWTGHVQSRNPGS